MAKAVYVEQTEGHTASLFRLASSVTKQEEGTTPPPPIFMTKWEPKSLKCVKHQQTLGASSRKGEPYLTGFMQPCCLPFPLPKWGLVPSSCPHDPAHQCSKKIECISLPWKPDNYRAFLEAFTSQSSFTVRGGEIDIIKASEPRAGCSQCLWCGGHFQGVHYILWCLRQWLLCVWPKKIAIVGKRQHFPHTFGSVTQRPDISCSW